MSELPPGDHALSLIFPDGSRREAPAYRRFNLLAHLDILDIDLPQKCGGQAECGTCRVRVISGAVTPAVGDEVELMTRHARRFRDGERLSCRARPRSDVVIELLALMPPDLRDVEGGDALPDRSHRSQGS